MTGESTVSPKNTSPEVQAVAESAARPTAVRSTVDSMRLIRLAVAAAESRQAENLRVLNLGKISDFTDYFLLGSGTNERQVQAIADAVVERLREEGVRPLHSEGEARGQWILLDYGGDLIVHVFLDETRRFYNLEGLWSDAPDETKLFLSEGQASP